MRCVWSVPLPTWTRVAIGGWTERARLVEGRVLRSQRQGDAAALGAGLSSQAIADVLAACAAPLGIDVAWHDCRRTFAKLASKGGARLEQTQLSQGHASIRTTERWRGVEQDLTDAPRDRLGLRLWFS
jgi:integrase